MYVYKAKLLKIIDSDTLDIEIDLGFNIRFETKVRLYGIDAPELKTEEGKKAKEYLSNILKDRELQIKTYKDKKEKYGRYLAEIFIDDRNINKELIEKGFAKEYYGKNK